MVKYISKCDASFVCLKRDPCCCTFLIARVMRVISYPSADFVARTRDARAVYNYCVLLHHMTVICCQGSFGRQERKQSRP